MAYSSSKLASSRSSCSFLNLLLSCLNLSLLILSAASLTPTLLLKTPPAPLGWAFVAVSATSLLSALMGLFYSQKLTRTCFVTHVSLLLAASVGQLLTILALFWREGSILSMLRSPRDPREAKLLVRIECGALMAAFLLQLGLLLVTCAVHSCWVRKYQGLEAEREAAARRRSRRMSRVQEESVANAEKIAEIRAKDMDEKMRGRYGMMALKADVES